MIGTSLELAEGVTAVGVDRAHLVEVVRELPAEHKAVVIGNILWCVWEEGERREQGGREEREKMKREKRETTEHVQNAHSACVTMVVLSMFGFPSFS